jgi:hypothetical protein
MLSGRAYQLIDQRFDVLRERNTAVEVLWNFLAHKEAPAVRTAT